MSDPPGPLTIVLGSEAEGKRLDRAIVHALEGRVYASREVVQRWMREGRVRVAGRVAKPSDRARAGGEVAIDVPPAESTEAVADPSVPFEVLHEDAHVIVVDKPAGVVVHPSLGHATGTLVNGLLGRGYFTLADVDALSEASEGGDRRSDVDAAGTRFVRPGIVHRIDKDTSGVLVVARTPEAREHLKAQFQAHSVERIYDAIVVGPIERGTFDTLFGRHPRDRVRFSSRVAEGKRAVTHVDVIERVAGGLATRVACRLETGRTHQIRVHLADAGHPLLGDPLYVSAAKTSPLREISDALGRQALHARVLGFDHPATGERLRFERPWPPDFESALRSLNAMTLRD